jgi:hypothetical protein
MSGRDLELAPLVEQAAGIVTASQSKVGIRKAMELVGFSAEELLTMKWYQQVRRRSMKLVVVEKERNNTPPSAVEAASKASATSDLTNSTNARKKKPATASASRAINEDDDDSSDAESISSARRRLNVDSPQKKKSPDKVAVKGKKTRKPSRMVHNEQAAKAAIKEANKQAMKAATRLVASNSTLSPGSKKSIDAIVKETNKCFDSHINSKTVGRYVRKGLIGVSPLKTGPIGDFPKRVYDALKHAYVTFLKLEQAECNKQSNTRAMAKLVNAAVNKAGHKRVRDDLTRKLKRDTADQLDVGKANIQEARRVRWTTTYNLDLWFSTWKDTMIDLCFAREKLASDVGVEGELFFFPGMSERILNMDETDGSIDDTTGQRGGRPALTFYAPDIGGGATAVNKSGYSATIICGSNAKGEPIPPHFQLKSTAQTDSGQRLSVDWFRHTKDVMVQFGHSVVKALPCTFGMNEKAGMNSIELEKYMRGSILPLYPDIADVPGKRVIMKVDSGPGRMNVEMLASLRLQGLYLVPGVPNTTGKTQETDQNYGPFKSGFRANIRTLTQARFDKTMTITVTDLPLLVFGGVCPRTGAPLKNAFADAFSMRMNLSCWRKCGSVPLTRSPVHGPGVRSQVPVGAAATRGDMSFVDPQVAMLKHVESLNHFYCDFLSASGYDGAKLRKNAPTRSTYVAVTEAHSQQRVEAIKTAKTAGQMFFATGGQHLNSDEFFQATELRNRQKVIDAMEAKKDLRQKMIKEQKEAVKIIREKGELTSKTFRMFVVPEIKILLKWKGAKPESSRKADIVKAYIEAKKPPIVKSWTRGEEAALLKQKERHVDLKDTALGVAAGQMARAVTNNLAQLDEDSLATLKTALGIFSAESGPNVI